MAFGRASPPPASGLAAAASRLLSAVLAFGLVGCATVKVTTESDRVANQGLQSAIDLKRVVNAPRSWLSKFAVASSDLLKGAALLESKGHDSAAAGCYLKSAVDAHALLVVPAKPPGSDEETALIGLYNHSLARFAELWAAEPNRSEPGSHRYHCEGETIVVSFATDSAYPADYFDRIVAAESVKQKGVVPQTRSGVGAALVGIREQRPDRAEEMRFVGPRGLIVPVTMTLDRARPGPGGMAVTLSLRNPLAKPEKSLGKRTVPLAADISAPLAMVLDGQSQAIWGLDSFFKADEQIHESGIFLTEPYDPHRIPVILTHGLISVPIIWRNIIPGVMADPDISSRYQFMVFTYPTSYPVYELAKLFRENLAALRATYDPEGRDPISTNVVAIGHSMGGILTRALVTDIGDRLWRQFCDEPFDQSPLSPEKREEIRDMIFFEPDPAVNRVIFIATPHRGAAAAEKGLSKWISRAARLPAGILENSAELFHPRVAQDLKLKVDLDQQITAVQSLSPGAPMIAALEVSPCRVGVVCHSIIGDRGRGDTPRSSDGKVEYGSSHLEGVASELIVPAGHRVYEHPMAIEEVRRILRENAGIR
jgi:pimeloyl-ACP methyl ester carboxylesterase